MSENMKTRRAALGALASIPALALPAVAMAGATDAAHEDADLFALIEAERALAPKVEEAERVEEEVKERTEWPEPPQTLLVTEDDNKVLWRPKNNRVYWCEFDRKELEAAINLFGRAPLKTWIPTRPDLIAYQSRSEQIVEALNQVKIARELAKERSGLAEAERLWTTLNAEHRQLWLRIAKTPARTPAGLLAKLSVVAAANCYQDEEDRDWETGSAEDILASLAVDATAMRLGAAV